MKHRLLDDSLGRRTYVVTMDPGEELMSNLTALAADLSLGGSSVSGIGGFQQATLGYFDPAKSDFHENHVDEQVELLSFIGNIAETAEGKPKIHAHVVLGRHDGTTRGGHLVSATIRPTLELIITENPGHLCRLHDDATGLVLLKP